MDNPSDLAALLTDFSRLTNFVKNFSASSVTPKFVRWAAVAFPTAILLVIAFLYSYWPTLAELEDRWAHEPDYSHGYLVVPLALYALWLRRDHLPSLSAPFAWPGFVLIGLSIVVRYVGARYYIGSVDAWSILFWLAGCCWLLCGWKVLKWALPAIIFLWFMIPLPHQFERLFRLPLQRVATKASCVVLQCLGQPALAEGTVIHLGDQQLEVEEACSGLRIFVCIAVLAFAYIMIVRPVWWERVALIVAVLPIALISNMARIVFTGFVFELTTDPHTREMWHDSLGFFMIPFAAGLFWILLWYMGKLIQEVSLADVHPMFRQGQRAV